MIDLLLVEDNPDHAWIFEMEAQPISQLKIRVAGMADEMWPEIAKGIPDVIFLDLNLPGASGLDILAELKTREFSKEIPVCIHSSSELEEDKRKAEILGAVGWLDKPISTRVLSRNLANFGLLKGNFAIG